MQFPSWEGLGVGYDPNASMHARSERALPMNQPLPVNCPVEPEDRDRSPVAARGPRQQPGNVTAALVLARPLRAGTARGPNLIGSWSQCMRRSESGLSMNRDSQTRMTNDQIRRDDQIRMTKPATAQLRAIGHSGFGFLSSLVIGHSSFNDFYRPTVPNECEKPKRAFHEAFGSLHHTTE